MSRRRTVVLTVVAAADVAMCDNAPACFSATATDTAYTNLRPAGLEPSRVTGCTIHYSELQPGNAATARSAQHVNYS